MLQEKLSREDLLQAALDSETVSKVDIKKIIIPKAMAAGKHLHPCPVVGYMYQESSCFRLMGKKRKY